MGARRTVLPSAERRFPNPIGRAAQVGRGTGIEVGAPYVVARRARPIVEIIEICLANGLSRSAELIEVVEGGIANVGAGTGLSEGHRWNEKEEENEESHESTSWLGLSLVLPRDEGQHPRFTQAVASIFLKWLARCSDVPLLRSQAVNGSLALEIHRSLLHVL